MTCLGCSLEKPIIARGLCQACYWRQRRNGSFVRKHVSNTGPCKAEGCDAKAFAKGFCGKHYQQQYQHPMRAPWKNLRSRAQGAYPKAWDDFDVFVAEIGGRPGPGYQLRRLDPDKPWSKTNSVWREPLGLHVTDPSYARAWHIRDKYGLVGNAEVRMFEKQKGICPICVLPLGRAHPETGKPIKTCIDHDHKTDLVRGLLCDFCNKGLGAFEDLTARLHRAIAYLEKDHGKDGG